MHRSFRAEAGEAARQWEAGSFLTSPICLRGHRFARHVEEDVGDEGSTGYGVRGFAVRARRVSEILLVVPFDDRNRLGISVERLLALTPQARLKHGHVAPFTFDRHRNR